MNYRKVGGIHFVRIGRLTVSFCLAKRITHQPLRYVLTPQHARSR